MSPTMITLAKARSGFCALIGAINFVREKSFSPKFWADYLEVKHKDEETTARCHTQTHKSSPAKAFVGLILIGGGP